MWSIHPWCGLVCFCAEVDGVSSGIALQAPFFARLADADVSLGRVLTVAPFSDTGLSFLSGVALLGRRGYDRGLGFGGSMRCRTWKPVVFARRVDPVFLLASAVGWRRQQTGPQIVDDSRGVVTCNFSVFRFPANLLINKDLPYSCLITDVFIEPLGTAYLAATFNAILFQDPPQFPSVKLRDDVGSCSARPAIIVRYLPGPQTPSALQWMGYGIDRHRSLPRDHRSANWARCVGKYTGHGAP